MVDFKKLMKRTPEQRAQDLKTIEDRYQADRQATILARTTQIEALMACGDTIPAKHAIFLRDMQYRSQTPDDCGALGGRLADLTDRQAAYLTSLHTQHCPQGPQARRTPSPFTIRPADVENGRYQGPVLNNEGYTVLQGEGRGYAVAHFKTNLDAAVRPGQQIEVRYQHGKGCVKSLEQDQTPPGVER